MAIFAALAQSGLKLRAVARKTRLPLVSPFHAFANPTHYKLTKILVTCYLDESKVALDGLFHYIHAIAELASLSGLAGDLHIHASFPICFVFDWKPSLLYHCSECRAGEERWDASSYLTKQSKPLQEINGRPILPPALNFSAKVPCNCNFVNEYFYSCDWSNKPVESTPLQVDQISIAFQSFYFLQRS